MSRRIIFVMLLVSVFSSAIELMRHRYEMRRLFSALQELQAEKNELDREWGQLLLEQGTWGTHGRIEDIARDELNMTLPEIEKTHRVRS